MKKRQRRPRHLPNAQQTLSLCMIVKNEEGNIGRCLESVKGVADEIIVVDTGSTDRTVEIARGYGARIVTTEWRDDFSEARNLSLSYSTCDWILVLDADEAMDQADKGVLRTLLTPSGPLAYLLNIESPVDDRRNSHAVINAFPRLFRNLPGVRFEGRIHEQVSPSIARIGGTISPSEIRVHHTGYHGAWIDLPAKRQRNIRLLEQQLRDRPNDPSAHFHLGEVYALEGRVGEAIACYRAALSVPGFPPTNRSVARRSLASCLLHFQRFEESWGECRLALEEDPGYALPHLTGAIALGKLGRYEAAVSQLDQYLSKVSSQGRGIHGVLGHVPNLAFAWAMKGDHYLAMQMVDSAERCYRTALTHETESAEGWLGMGKIFRLQGRIGEAASAFEKAARLFEGIPNGHLALAQMYAELERWAEALESCRAFLRVCPESVGGLEIYAQSLLKLRRYEEAEQVYRRCVAQAPSGMTYFALACLADARGDRGEVADLCRKAWEYERTDARIPFLLGCCLLERGEYREALNWLLEAERLAPGTPEIEQRLKLLGRMLEVGAGLAAPSPISPVQQGERAPLTSLQKRGAGGCSAFSLQPLTAAGRSPPPC